MRTSRSWPTGTLGCALILTVAVTACRAPQLRHQAPSDDPSEHAPASHTGTSSDTHVDRDQNNQRFSRIEELIEGRAPGVRVIRHQDGTFRLQIRGVSSPSGRNDPLVVIDGTPAIELRSGSALASLNPADVDRIDVLKDAASTAFYGMRGANGVIVITTRQH